MDGVISFILFLIIGFYLAGLIGRLLLRRWIIRRQKEFEQNGGNPFFRTYTWGAGAHQQQSRQREGDVTVQQTAQSAEKKISREVGDYVDYEEVKEKEK